MATKNVKGVKRADGNTYLYKDADARTKIGTATLTTTAQNLSGAVNELNAGKASLENGKVPVSQLPSYVDDVLEYANKASFPATGESGKIYVDLATNLTYRWSGSAYVEISPSLALGETSSTAYAGNKGKANADAIAVLNGTGTGSVSKAITNAINALDVSSVGGTGKYISAISEADGKISATAETMDDAPTENSNKPVKSGGVFSAIENSVSLKTATGNPITLTDAANANAEELLMTIEPVQSGSGDPSPTNVRPISGLTSGEVTRTGFNIWDEEWEVGDIAFASGMDISSSSYIRNKGYIPVIPNMAYYYCTEDSSSTFLFFYDENYTYLGQTTGGLQYVRKNSIFTTPNCAFMRFAKQTTTYNNDICINISDPDKNGTYEPYTATTTASITFGQTVYGGSVNFKTGEVTVTHGIKKFSELSWLKNNNIFYTLAIQDIKIGSVISDDFLCDYYTPVLKEWTALDNGNCVLRKGVSSNNYYSLAVRDDAYNTTSDFITAQGDRSICYELATPTTLTLTPAELELLKGANTITANGAEISLSYYPDNAIGVLAGRVDDMPTALSDLTADSTHRTVTDTEKSTWNGKMDTPVVYEDNSSAFMAFTNSSMVGYFTNDHRYIKGGVDANSTPYIQLWKAGYDSVKLSNTEALFKVYNHQIEYGINGIVGSGNGANYTVDLSQTKLSYLNNITSDVQTQIDRFNNNVLPNNLNTYTNNGARTIYQSVMAYINGLSGSSKPRGFVQFFITYEANAMPSDLPSDSKWYYAWGEIYFRNGYETATIILHPFVDDGTMIIKYVISSYEKTWQTVLTDKSASKVGSFNIDTTQHPNAENNFVVRQFGKVVSISGYILRANLPNSNTSYRLGTLSNVSNPPIDIRTLGTIANAAYDNGDNAYLYIGTDRAIYLKTRTLVGSNMAVYFSVTYIAD